MAIRHRSRHLRATIVDRVKDGLTDLGWVDTALGPINFGADPVLVVDYQPDERGETIVHNTVAVSLGDVVNDEDEELGGGLRSAWYPVFIDVYMSNQALTDAVCDDIRELFDTKIFPLVNQISGADAAERIEVDEVIGPDRPNASLGIDQFKRYWRIMRLGVRLYYQP